MKSNIEVSINKALTRFLPPEKISLDEWAEKNIFLSPALSSVPGRLNLDFSPHIRHILKAVDDPKYNKFTWISGVQTGKTLFEMVIAAYFMAVDPSNILLFEPDAGLARSIAVERFNPLIDANPFLKNLFTGSRTKNNDEEKIFTGGYLNFCSAGSLNDLISRSARIVLLDEVDSYKTDLKDRGNPIQLAKDRTIQQPRSKFFMVGSPGSELSELFQNYEKSNKAVVEYACIHCGEFQDLKFSSLKWEEGSEGYGAWYQCKFCSKKIFEGDKFKFFKDSKLRFDNPKPSERDHFGLWTNGLYSMSPKLTWEQIAIDHISAHRRKDKADRKRFTNSILAEMFIESRYKIKESWLMERAKVYVSEVPRHIGMLSAGVDIQHDRAEITVLGHGKQDKIAVIDHKIIYGNTAADPESTEYTIWKELDVYLNRPFKHESGREIYIKTAFADVQDGTNPAIKKYCRTRMSRGIFPSSGRAGRQTKNIDGYFGPTMQDRITKMPIIPLDTIRIKDEVFDRLIIDDENTYRYVSFPKHLDDNYYKGLLSEKRKEKKEAGIVKVTYEKIHERNEPLDCFCYAFAAFNRLMGRDLYLFEQVCDVMASPFDAPIESLEEISEPIKTESKPSFNFYEQRKQLIGR